MKIYAVGHRAENNTAQLNSAEHFLMGMEQKRSAEAK